MVESKLIFLEVQIEDALGQAIEFSHTPLGVAPETLNSIDVLFTSSVLSLLHG